MSKKVLITAGTTAFSIDQVRVISPDLPNSPVSIKNIFRGKTGADIAKYFARKGDQVTLATSGENISGDGNVRIIPYITFQGLESIMEQEITGGQYDIIIHSAAVADFMPDKAYGRTEDGQLVEIDSTKKISSKNPELFLRFVPTPKLIDKIREPWGFQNVLVKFKLEVGISDNELLQIAQKSMRHSKANFIVANCLEWADERAIIITDNKSVTIPFFDLQRYELPSQLYNLVKRKLCPEEHADRKQRYISLSVKDNSHE